VAGSCEHSNEPSDSINGEEYHDYLAITFSRRVLFHVVSELMKICDELLHRYANEKYFFIGQITDLITKCVTNILFPYR